MPAVSEELFSPPFALASLCHALQEQRLPQSQADTGLLALLPGSLLPFSAPEGSKRIEGCFTKVLEKWN